MIRKSTTKSVISSLLLAFVLWACSGNDTASLLEKIPANAKCVTIVNLKNIVIQSGCKIEQDGQITLTPQLESFLEKGDVATNTLFQIISKTASFINTEKMAWFVPNNYNGAVLIFDINNKDQLNQYLSSSSVVSTSQAGYSIYAFPECVVLTKGNSGWIARDANTVIEIQNSIGKKHFAAFSPVREFLENDPHDIETVINNSENTASELQYILGLANFKSSGIFAEFSFMDAEGKIYRFSNNIHEVERDLLKYVPSQTQILFAFGKIDDWDKIFNAIENENLENIANKYALYYHIAKDYLRKINGTTLLALAPFAGSQSLLNLSPETWQILFMSHLSQEDTDEILSTARMFVGYQFGMTEEDDNNNNYKLKLGNYEITFGEIEDYIFASNYDILEGGNTNMAPAYESKRAVAQLTIPYGSETMKALELPWGVDFNISLNGTNVMFVLRLPGANGPVLANLIQYLSLQ